MTNDLTLSTELYSGMITLASQMKVVKMNSVEIDRILTGKLAPGIYNAVWIF